MGGFSFSRLATHNQNTQYLVVLILQGANCSSRW